MGRGLSEMQRWILRAAGRRREEAKTQKKEKESALHLYTWEILHGYCGWRLGRQHDGRLGKPRGEVTEGDRLAYRLTKPYKRAFDSESSRGRNANSDRAAASRAMKRLQARGLVEGGRGVSPWAAVILTEAGQAWLDANRHE